jgi:hypothetical protein
MYAQSTSPAPETAGVVLRGENVQDTSELQEYTFFSGRSFKVFLGPPDPSDPPDPPDRGENGRPHEAPVYLGIGLDVEPFRLLNKSDRGGCE